MLNQFTWYWVCAIWYLWYFQILINYNYYLDPRDKVQKTQLQWGISKKKNQKIVSLFLAGEMRLPLEDSPQKVQRFCAQGKSQSKKESIAFFWGFPKCHYEKETIVYEPRVPLAEHAKVWCIVVYAKVLSKSKLSILRISMHHTKSN